MPHAIGHLDADCFYISAERVRNPFLLGKPVGVLGNQGACVIAKSYEMKAMGVKTGVPIWEAVVLCPQGIYVKRDFRWYEVLSRRMLDVVRELSPRVEYYSIDEFFFQAEPMPGLTLQQTAERIRDHILKTVKVPVTVGIARTKTLAKLISDTAKPFGALAVLDQYAERELLARTPVIDVSGIGRRRGLKLVAQGIRSALDFARADRRFIRKMLTIVGEGLWYELNGESVQPFHTTRPPHKMLARGGSVGQPTNDANYLWGWAVRSLERLIEELEYHRVRPARLDVWIMYKDDISCGGGMTLTSPTARFDLLLDAVRLGFEQSLRPGKIVHRLHVIASHLQWPGPIQQGLFEPPAERAMALADLKREVNERRGRFALRSGATLFLPGLYEDEAYSYEICDVRGKMCF